MTTEEAINALDLLIIVDAPGLREAVKMAISALRAQHEAEKQWISVKDGLPDTAERVLVCKTWNGMVYKPDYGYHQNYPNRKGSWFVLTEFGYYPQTEVTYWMPLPEPPKEG